MLDYEFNVSVQVELNAFDLMPAPHKSGFVNATLFVALAISIGCAVVDWTLSKGRKKKIKEVVGDYWTHLSYTTLWQLFANTWRSCTRQLMLIAGPKPLGPRRILAAPLLHILLAYVVWWITFYALLARHGESFGPIYRPGLRITAFRANAQVWVPFVTWLILCSWVSWSSFLWAIQRFSPDLRGMMRMVLPVCVSGLVVTGLTAGFLLCYLEPKELLSQLTYHASTITGVVTGTINGRTDGPDVQLVNFFFKALIEGGTNAIRYVLWLTLFLSCLSWVLGPILCWSLLLLSVWTCSAFLKLTQRWLQPFTMFVLEKVYTSERGVISQIGAFIGLLVKGTDELIKFFFLNDSSTALVGLILFYVRICQNAERNAMIN